MDILDQPPGSWSKNKAGWELLKDVIDHPVDYETDDFSSKSNYNRKSEISPISRINVGIAIVLFGHEHVLNYDWDSENQEDRNVLETLNRPELVTSTEDIRDHITLAIGKEPSLPLESRSFSGVRTNTRPIYVPLLKFGELVIIERREIQAIRSIRNLFRGYHEASAKGIVALPPISVAVFGPPGSGKSFVMRQLAKDIKKNLQNPNHCLELIEYNVAQFRSVDELGEAITRASVINNEGKTPILFFDEFDCAFDGNQLRWLKYFLAPMQDEKFYGVRQTIKIARAIFVFAGGIYYAFKKFDPSPESDSIPVSDRRLFEEREKRLQSFADQKGPDFVSRLRGHIDILPVEADNGLVKPIIRRAIILRGILMQRNLVAKKRRHVAYIDKDVVYALLTLDRYRHGARSMYAIIEMCTPIQGKIEKSSLPSREQLNMHIDADEFFIRMYRGRFRPSPPPPPAGPNTSPNDEILSGGSESATSSAVAKNTAIGPSEAAPGAEDSYNGNGSSEDPPVNNESLQP